MSPFDGLLDVRRVDPVPGDMADVVHIPIEASCAVQHSYSIYNYCIYSKATCEERPLSFGRQEVTIYIGSAAALCKVLTTAIEGYAGDVPVTHQAVAVKAATDAMDTAFAGTSSAPC